MIGEICKLLEVILSKQMQKWDLGQLLFLHSHYKLYWVHRHHYKGDFKDKAPHTSPNPTWSPLLATSSPLLVMPALPSTRRKRRDGSFLSTVASGSPPAVVDREASSTVDATWLFRGKMGPRDQVTAGQREWMEQSIPSLLFPHNLASWGWCMQHLGKGGRMEHKAALHFIPPFYRSSASLQRSPRRSHTFPGGGRRNEMYFIFPPFPGHCVASSEQSPWRDLATGREGEWNMMLRSIPPLSPQYGCPIPKPPPPQDS